jgi:hypothetical protein
VLRLLLILLAWLLPAAPPAGDGGAGVVSPRGSVASLRIDEATAIDVVRFAGVPGYVGIGSFRPGASIVPPFLALGYQCHRVRQGSGIPLARRNSDGSVGGTVDCETTYYVNLRTRTLGYFLTYSAAFRTATGARNGEPWSRVKEHGVQYVNCGGLFVSTRQATMSLGHAGPDAPQVGDRPAPYRGGTVAWIDLESVPHPLSFGCW